MRKRIVCCLLCVALLLGMFSGISVHAATASQNNIVARADYLYGLTWTCKQTVSGWRGSYTFSKGTTYRLPYGQPVTTGKYIGFGVSISDFLKAANTAGSVFYSSRSSYSGNGSSSVYYALDCSAFVSWCWGISRKTTYSLTQVASSLGAPTTSNISKLKLGDALNSRSVGHVVLVTGLTYSGSSISKIEITEQTPPQLKRTTYTPSSLASKYSGSYTILRYSGTVPAAPGSSGSSDGSKYFPACNASYESIVTALDSIGVDSSKDYRTTIAEANGITNYTGTAEQNIAMLDLLKAGLLINPKYSGSSGGSGGSSGTTTSIYYPACSSSCTTLVEGLQSIGVDSSKEFRTKIAAANGITDYTGTYDQNILMFDLLKAGKLINPDASSGNSSGTTNSGSFVNGYANGYTGGMAGDGKIYAQGLDVSAWQGSSLNFNTIKNAGYDYVILRVGTTKGKDTCFETFYTNARAAGLDIGAYYYSYATTVAGAQTDAKNTLSWLGNKTFEYPIYFDYEDASQDSLSTSLATSICLTFCDTLADAGYLTGVYTGYSRSTNLPMSTICAKYEIWIARYYDYTYQSLSPTYCTKYGMYQYTDRNYIGSNGPYDGNVAYKDYPSIVKKYGFNGYGTTVDYLEECTFYPTHCTVTTTKSTPLNTLPSSTSYNGSQTLVTAEAGQTYTANRMYCNTGGNYWYQVTLETGETAYLYSGHCSFSAPSSSDITLFGGVAPSALNQGDGFDIGGFVSATNNRLDSVQVQVSDAEGNILTSTTVNANENQCDLSAMSLEFEGMSIGAYTYTIIANYSGDYATEPTVKTTYTARVVLKESPFNITDYLEQCTVYPLHGTVTVTQDTPLNTLPSSTSYNNSQTVTTAKANQVYTAIALYRNSGGTYWYLVALDSGEEVFISGSHVQFNNRLDTDIFLSDAVVPEALTQGINFEIGGILQSLHNRLEGLDVMICTTDGTTVATNTATAADNWYDLTELAMDFTTLTPGSYVYKVVAKYSGHYATGSSEMAAYSDQVVLIQAPFTVAENYLLKCTVYPTHCTVIPTQDTPLNTLPSSTSYNNSQTVTTAKANQVYTANALYRNTGGTYWYQIALDSGESVFMASNHCTFGESLSTDISLSDAVAPGELLQGNPFEVSGTVQALRNQLDGADVTIYNENGTQITTSSATASEGECDLSGLTMNFEALALGSYVYKVTARYTGYYAASATELASYSKEISLMEVPFGVSRDNSPEAYLAQCAAYPTHCQVTVNQDTTLNTLPVSTDFDLSEAIITARTGETFTATALYCNVDGIYWYQIALEDGETAYLAGNHASFNTGLRTGITLTDSVAPESLTPGEAFHPVGMVHALFVQLDAVEVRLCTASGDTTTVASAATASNEWDLSGMTVECTNLRSGDYLYQIVAQYSGYYALSATELTSYTDRIVLLEAPVILNTCVHNYVVEIIQTETCTTNGILKRTCTICGISSLSTIAALGHDETITIQEPTCVSAGVKTILCNRCGYTETVRLSATGHSYEALTSTPTCTAVGFTTYTCAACGDAYTADHIGATGHRYEAHVTPPTCTADGFTANTCADCGDTYTTDPVPASGHSYEAYVTAPTCTTAGFTTHVCVSCDDAYATDTVSASGHRYTATVTAPTCVAEGFTTYTCTACGDAYTADPVAALGHSYEAFVTAPTCSKGGFTTYLCDCGDAYVGDRVPASGHSFVNGSCSLCGTTDPGYTQPAVAPTIALKFPSLSFEDTIIMNVYYTATNRQDVVEMGLITNTVKPDVVSIENADAVIPGYYWSEGDQMYYSNTAGIAPKDIGDTIYFAVYAKLTDGTVSYTRMIGYSPKTYAMNMLKTGTTQMKPLVAAMLNYGAAAQIYFGYKTDALMNAAMTDEQKALVAAYEGSMIATAEKAAGDKLGTFINDKTYSSRYATVSFEGAFCINYYYKPSLTVEGDVMMYIWDLEAFEANDVLTRENATKAIKMTRTDSGEYTAAMDGIAAKDLDKGVYVSFVYSDGTTEHCGGVLTYTIGTYCKTQAAKTGALSELAKACAVYGYYAKQLFN